MTIKRDAQNARKHSDANKSAIRKSLETVGAGRSILLDAEDNVLAGNGVLEQAEAMGIPVQVVESTGDKLIAVKRTDLSGDKARQAATLDNIVADTSAFDYSVDLLRDALANDAVSRAIAEQRDELRALLKAPPKAETVDAGALVDKAAELQAKWQTALGQIWELGAHRLIIGDCTDSETVKALMQGDLCSLAVIDPPYGVSYADKNKFLNAISPGNRIQTEIKNDHESKEKTQELWKSAFCEMSKVMQSGAVVYCFMPQGGDQMMMMMMMMMGAGIEPRHELIWLKNNHVLGRVDYAYKHEPILYAWKDGGHKFYGDFQTSILEFPKPQSSNLHPTTKPVELIEKLVSNSSRVDDIVYDGFIGSGTTMLACERLQRKCRAIELEPNYAAVVCERWALLTGLTPRRVAS